MAHPRRLSSRLLAAATSGAAALSACVSSSPPLRSSARPLAPAPAAAVVTYDWHPLILAPFGTLLKDMPVALSEILQFHDAARSGRETEDRDCYTPQGSPPQFLGRRPDDYLLCFDHDRLNRIEASVQLPSDGAAPIFAAACAEWQLHGQPVAGTPDRCEARDGAIDLSAHLSSAADSAQAADSHGASSADSSMATVSLSLTRAAP